MNKVLPLAIFLLALAAGAGSLFLVAPESATPSPSASASPRIAVATPTPTGLLPLVSDIPAVAMPSLLPLRFTPQPPSATSRPTTPASPGVEVVIFEDLLCAPCARQFREQLLPFLREIGSGATLKFYPLPTRGSESEVLAKAAFCADQAGKSLPFREAFFAAERKVPAEARKIITDLGVDADAYESCLVSDAAQKQLADAASAATANGVVAVPTAIIGGRLLEGSQPIENLRHFYKKAVAQNQ